MAVSQSEVLFKDRSTYLLLKEGVETATSVLVDPSVGLLIQRQLYESGPESLIKLLTNLKKMVCA